MAGTSRDEKTALISSLAAPSASQKQRKRLSKSFKAREQAYRRSSRLAGGCGVRSGIATQPLYPRFRILPRRWPFLVTVFDRQQPYHLPVSRPRREQFLFSSRVQQSIHPVRDFFHDDLFFVVLSTIVQPKVFLKSSRLFKINQLVNNKRERERERGREKKRE